LSDPDAVLAAAQRSEAAVWQALAPRWGLALSPADGEEPCAAAARQQLLCFRGILGLAQVRALDRPGLLTLRDAKDLPVYALLTGLSDDAATLQFGDTLQQVPLLTLAGLWRGDFATLWRAPPAYRGPPSETASGPLAAWLDSRLPGDPAQPLKVRVSAFQVANGLKPDGLAGPVTLMHINRASGIDEPRLHLER
jgi:general secretion pathway protein A